MRSYCTMPLTKFTIEFIFIAWGLLHMFGLIAPMTAEGAPSHQHMYDAIVRVYQPSDDGTGANDHVTGVMFRAEGGWVHVFTCAHGVTKRGGAGTRIWPMKATRSAPAELLHASGPLDGDWAVFRFRTSEDEEWATLPLSPRALVIGERVKMIGVPSAAPGPVMRFARITRKDKAVGRDGTPFFHISTRALNGDSGSPIIDEGGHVIGVIHTNDPELGASGTPAWVTYQAWKVQCRGPSCNAPWGRGYFFPRRRTVQPQPRRYVQPRPQPRMVAPATKPRLPAWKDPNMVKVDEGTVPYATYRRRDTMTAIKPPQAPIQAKVDTSHLASQAELTTLSEQMKALRKDFITLVRSGQENSDRVDALTKLTKAQGDNSVTVVNKLSQLQNAVVQQGQAAQDLTQQPSVSVEALANLEAQVSQIRAVLDDIASQQEAIKAELEKPFVLKITQASGKVQTQTGSPHGTTFEVRMVPIKKSDKKQ